MSFSKIVYTIKQYYLHCEYTNHIGLKMSYSISHETENTEKAKTMAKEDGGGLSGLLIRLVNKEYRKRKKLEKEGK